MDTGSIPGPRTRAHRPDDEAQWQSAINEGWPDRAPPHRAHPSGAVAPVIALALPSNVVDMQLWRLERAPAQRTATGG